MTSVTKSFLFYFTAKSTPLKIYLFKRHYRLDLLSPKAVLSESHSEVEDGSGQEWPAHVGVGDRIRRFRPCRTVSVERFAIQRNCRKSKSQSLSVIGI
jgi:hypothetical protein